MRFRIPISLVLVARVAAAQATGSTVSGVVRDSVGRVPLGRAVVQLVHIDSLGRSGRSVVADSVGRFSFSGISAGRYTVGFFHPLLDSLSLEPTLHAFDVDGRRAVVANIGTPSAARLRAAICGTRSAADSGSVLVGSVRDAQGHTAIAGARVTAEWLELTITAKGIEQRIPTLSATTVENGWFAICNLPRAGTLLVRASHGADSTAAVEVQMAADGFARRELYVGSSPVSASGVVLGAVGEKPLPDAQVSVVGGPQTRANERGEWALSGVPGGTRMIEVRAVGYYPERRAVNIVTGGPPIRTAMLTMKSVLDTVRVTASLIEDRHLSGFNDRRRSGAGRYLTAEDIARRNLLTTSDIFMMTPGIKRERTTTGQTVFQMRSRIESTCTPAIYIDGMYMRELDADDLDTAVNPDEISGIEIYVGITTPPQFTPGSFAADVCGSIVIWTKAPRLNPNRAGFKGRLLGVSIFIAIVAGLTALGSR